MQPMQQCSMCPSIACSSSQRHIVNRSSIVGRKPLVACSAAATHHRNHPRCAAKLVGQRSRCPSTSCCGWQAFVRERRTGSKRSLAEIGEEWRSLGEAEKRRRRSQPAVLPAAVPRPAAAAPPTSVWPCAGDDYYPITAEHLGEVPQAVRTLNQLWQRTVGDGVVKPAAAFEAPVRHLCEETLGWGNCESLTDAATKARLEGIRRALRVWAGNGHPKAVRFDEVWGKLAMLYFGPKGDPPAGSADEPRGRVALLLYMEVSPLMLIFCHQPSLALQPGCTVNLDLELPRLTTHVSVVRTNDIQN